MLVCNTFTKAKTTPNFHNNIWFSAAGWFQLPKLDDPLSYPQIFPIGFDIEIFIVTSLNLGSPYRAEGLEAFLQTSSLLWQKNSGSEKTKRLQVTNTRYERLSACLVTVLVTSQFWKSSKIRKLPVVCCFSIGLRKKQVTHTFLTARLLGAQTEGSHGIAPPIVESWLSFFQRVVPHNDLKWFQVSSMLLPALFVYNTKYHTLSYFSILYIQSTYRAEFVFHLWDSSWIYVFWAFSFNFHKNSTNLLPSLPLNKSPATTTELPGQWGNICSSRMEFPPQFSSEWHSQGTARDARELNVSPGIKLKIILQGTGTSPKSPKIFFQLTFFEIHIPNHANLLFMQKVRGGVFFVFSLPGKNRSHILPQKSPKLPFCRAVINSYSLQQVDNLPQPGCQWQIQV